MKVLYANVPMVAVEDGKLNFKMVRIGETIDRRTIGGKSGTKKKPLR